MIEYTLVTSLSIAINILISETWKQKLVPVPGGSGSGYEGTYLIPCRK
jgi:hypothetical protein